MSIVGVTSVVFVSISTLSPTLTTALFSTVAAASSVTFTLKLFVTVASFAASTSFQLTTVFPSTVSVVTPSSPLTYSCPFASVSLIVTLTSFPVLFVHLIVYVSTSPTFILPSVALVVFSGVSGTVLVKSLPSFVLMYPSGTTSSTVYLYSFPAVSYLGRFVYSYFHTFLSVSLHVRVPPVTSVFSPSPTCLYSVSFKAFGLLLLSSLTQVFVPLTVTLLSPLYVFVSLPVSVSIPEMYPFIFSSLVEYW